MRCGAENLSKLLCTNSLAAAGANGRDFPSLLETRREAGFGYERRQKIISDGVSTSARAESYNCSERERERERKAQHKTSTVTGLFKGCGLSYFQIRGE